MATSGRRKSEPKKVQRITRWEDGSTSPKKQRWSQPKYGGSTGRSGSTKGPAWTDPFTGQKRTGGVYTPPKTDSSKINTKKNEKNRILMPQNFYGGGLHAPFYAAEVAARAALKPFKTQRTAKEKAAMAQAAQAKRTAK